MWSTLGQDLILRMLQEALRQGTLAHAYLIVGPAHSGKGTLARDIARAVNCERQDAVPISGPCGECRQCQRIADGKHADVVTIAVDEAEGRKAIRIAQIRDALHSANLQPYEGRFRAFIIDSAEYMNDEAANALLKTLEEPPPNVLWLLLAAEEDQVIPTIRSRCQRLALRPAPAKQAAQWLQEKWGATPEHAQLLAQLAKGALGWAVNAVQDPSILEARTRTLERLTSLPAASLEERFAYAAELATLIPRERVAARELLDLWASWWRDILLLRAGVAEGIWNQDKLTELKAEESAYQTAAVSTFVQALIRAKQVLDMNVSPRLVFENLMLLMPSSAQSAHTTVSSN